jgi:CRISPR system Cascade subunit CasB
MSKTKPDKPKLERERKFLQAIEGTINKDNGAKADLKRSLSGEIKHIRSTYPIIFRYLGGIEYNQDEWILVAGLFAYYPQKLDRDSPKNFGSSSRGLALANKSEGADRRFRALLDTSIEDIRSPLIALIRQIKSKDIAIDYPQLLADLCRWEHPNEYIQDRWAKSFWGYEPPEGGSKPQDAIDDE